MFFVVVAVIVIFIVLKRSPPYGGSLYRCLRWFSRTVSAWPPHPAPTVYCCLTFPRCTCRFSQTCHLTRHSQVPTRFHRAAVNLASMNLCLTGDAAGMVCGGHGVHALPMFSGTFRLVRLQALPPCVAPRSGFHWCWKKDVASGTVFAEHFIKINNNNNK